MPRPTPRHAVAEPSPELPGTAGFVPLDDARLPGTLDGLLSRAAAVRPGHPAAVPAPARHLTALLAEAPPEPAAPPAALSPHDVVCLHFTSGTTGRPKAVRLTHRNLVVNAHQIAVAHALNGDSVTVNHLPTY